MSSLKGYLLGLILGLLGATIIQDWLWTLSVVGIALLIFLFDLLNLIEIQSKEKANK